jgi:hypothetical protein
VRVPSRSNDSCCRHLQEDYSSVLRYIDLYSFDKRVQSYEREMKEDGVYPSQWFANISLYLVGFLRIAGLFHGGRPQMVPALHFFFHQIARKGDGRDICNVE